MTSKLNRTVENYLSVVVLVSGVILRNMVTLETLASDDFDIKKLFWFIQGKLAGMLFSASFRRILGAAQNDQQLESGALLKGTSEHFKADKGVRN